MAGMTDLLIVDDSAVDRRFVEGLLEASPDWTVRFATNGVEALAVMEEAPPDLVVTDLIMPEMDGLQLVGAIRSRYPRVPVILITGEGSGDIAVAALRQGAAGFVPKQELANDLLDSVRNVLAISGDRARQARLIECMQRNECVFVIDNDVTLFPPLVGFLQENAMQIGLCDETGRVRIGIALEEALANAVYHGNLEIESSLREADAKRYEALLEERRRQLPYCHRRIHVKATFTRGEALFVIRDEGPGFDPSDLPDPTDPANLEKVTGRGVLLMRSFMDEVVYNSEGNEVTLHKRRERRA
jgi:CheY-like chemotaxis protein